MSSLIFGFKYPTIPQRLANTPKIRNIVGALIKSERSPNMPDENAVIPIIEVEIIAKIRPNSFSGTCF